MSITIGFTGDVMIGRLVNTFLDTAPPQAIWGNLLEELHATDLNVVNLEAALTKSEKIVPKVFNFKADPEKVQSLLEGRIDVVNLANNHVLDYSEEGLFETLETLDRVQILHVGAGRNLEEAKRAAIVSRRDLKIGILGFTDNEPTWKATKSKPGVNYLRVGDLDAALNEIDPLRKKVDILIFSYHWGPNMRETPSPEFIQFAHQLIDHGVDIFHGHSAHLFQGYEEYHKGLILYDTGDFVDDYYVDPLLRNDQSFFFVVQMSKKEYESLRTIPVVIKDFSVRLAKGREKEKILKRMEYRSKSIPLTLSGSQRPL